MPADNIFQQYMQPAKSVLDYQNEFENSQALRNRNALSSLSLQQQTQQSQQDMAERNALQRLAGGWNANTSPDARIADLRNSGMPGLMKQADALETQSLTRGKTLAETRQLGTKADAEAATVGKTTQETATNAYDLRVKKSTQAISDISALNSSSEARASIMQHVAAGDVAQDKADLMLSALPQDPRDQAGFRKWQSGLLLGVMGAKDALEAQQPKMVSAGGALVNTNALAGPTGQGAPSAIPITQTRDNAANNAAHIQGIGMTNATSLATNKATIAKDLTVAGLTGLDGKPVEDGGLARLDRPSIVNAGARYNIDGTLPPNIGRGNQGSVNSVSILKEAAAQAAERGDSAESQRVNQLANKASASALGALSKQEAIVGAAEKNFTANANMVTGLSQKVDRTGVPILNAWVNAGRRAITGNPDISAFDANIKATVNEYAKIVGGGTGGGATAQGEIAKIEGLLSAAQTPAQVEAVLNVMRQETANRMKSFTDQKSELMGNMLRSKLAGSHAAPGGVAPTPGKVSDLGNGFTVKH